MNRPPTPAPSPHRQSRPSWRTSSRSQTSNCVEVASLGRGAQVAVRDSKDRGGPVLVFDRRQWSTFIAGAKDGRFDLT